MKQIATCLSTSLRHTCPSRKAQCRCLCVLPLGCQPGSAHRRSRLSPGLLVFILSGPLSVPEFSVIVGMLSLSATDCYIVHEIYNGENAQDQFEYELEQALEAQYKYIVIEPTRIGDETARWITVGNCLHKTTVLAGTACLFTPLALPLDYSHYISLPAGVLSLACCTLYGISWQFDPCCKYQVEYDAYRLSRLPLHTLTSSTPVVLVRKDDLHRKRLHNTIALAALVYCVKKVYELYAV
ncbi:transmembrane protein 11, mitochondrial isoform 1-T1 [Molossus nigricans]|uniref:Transmembrane protein 11 n=1 Tax=Molossus molossus TaxID=27622 RepID=A0A7J8BK05_MOLMO|nr:transmembrane protein 11, mitochondrial isoform X3 [Molossus molossus]KAF6398746.1 transmembrane protein 11 [Molossus molossus]